ncbi:MAG: T9SS C-terminal target domain-containing protein [Ignavibacteriae bacterium]|nr:MAG: T9SS C-terminal target domain-containing protein [Ignavibacteriota bacterium]
MIMKKITIIVLAFVLIGFANIFAQTWTQQTPTGVTTDLNSIWAVDHNVVWACGPSHVVLRTINGGVNWTSVGAGIAAGQDLYTVSAYDANICVVGSGDGTLWRTSNGGANWVFIVPTPASVFINVVHLFPGTPFGFAQGDPVGNLWKLWYTTNQGANWTTHPTPPTAVGTEAGWNNSYFALDTGHIWYGTNATKIWKGGMRGPFTSGPTTGEVNSFGVWFNDVNTGVATMTNASYAVLPNMTSVNGGTSWTVGFAPANTMFGLRGVPGTGYVWMSGGSSSLGQIYRSTNSGVNWTAQTISVANSVYGLSFVHQGLGWASTAAGKIFKYVDPNFTGVGTPGNELPTSFKLEQNYPNPFNPSTTINYSIPKASEVSIKVYDMLGHEVMTLVNEQKNAGNYSVVMDASNLSSGIYLYKIAAGSFNETKRMTLIK